MLRGMRINSSCGVASGCDRSDVACRGGVLPHRLLFLGCLFLIRAFRRFDWLRGCRLWIDGHLRIDHRRSHDRIRVRNRFRLFHHAGITRAGATSGLDCPAGGWFGAGAGDSGAGTMSAASAADVRRQANITTSSVIRSMSHAISTWIDLPTGKFPCINPASLFPSAFGEDTSW